VDIPNSMDDMWKITVDKSDAQLPAALRARLRQVVDNVKKKSARTYRRRGGRIDHPTAQALWKRYSRNNEIRYEINRDHSVIAALVGVEDPDVSKLARLALQQIEQNFPVTAFSNDSLTRGDCLSQSITDPASIKTQLEVICPRLLAQHAGDMRATLATLRNTEPFEAHWAFVENTLKEWGWES
jgi:hypothetical protein